MTKGALSGKAGETAHEDFKINGQYVNTPETRASSASRSSTSTSRRRRSNISIAAAKSGKPFFMNINFMKVHQPNMPAPDFMHKSLSKSKYADSVVEIDTRIGRIMDKVRALGLDKNTLRLLDDRQRRLAGRLSRCRLHAVPRHQGHRARGRQPRSGHRLDGRARSRPAAKNHDIVGGLDLMATFAALGGVKLPENDREGKPIIFDSYDMSPVLFGTGKSARKSWFYFTENELTPGAARVGNYKAVFNLRGDDGAADRRPRRRHQPRLEGRRRSMSPPCRRSSTSGRTRRSATTSS